VSGYDLSRFVATGDSAAFAESLRELLLDPDVARALGVRGRLYADHELGWGLIAQTTRDVYESVLVKRR
jgi:hypothetical protein